MDRHRRQNQFGTEGKVYSVQTSLSVLERCILMTTAPGDLIFDPTCGSGTTAYVAEQWGRRWVTCDTSRVPLALARQRLLTAAFPWYKLAQPEKGPVGGFVYERKQNGEGEEVGGLVPHITLKSIAYNEEPKMETLANRPEISKGITRVTGPFVVEATIPAPADLRDEQVRDLPSGDVRTHIDRMLKVLRQSQTLRLPGNRTLKLDAVRPMADAEYLHAEALEDNGKRKRIAISFGHDQRTVFDRRTSSYCR